MHPLTLIALSSRLEGQISTLLETLLGALIVVAISFAAFYIGRMREAMTGVLARRFRNHAQLRPLTAAGHQDVSNLMRDLRVRFKASRVCLFQFHNGVSFMLANHAWKISCSHESITSGVESTAFDNQELHVGAVIDWIHPLLNSDHNIPGVRNITACSLQASMTEMTCPHGKKGHRVVYYDVNAMDMSAGQALANRQNVHHVFAVTLLDVDRKSVIGFLALQFADMTPAHVLDVESEICAMCPVAEKIQFYLTTDVATYRAKSGLWRWLFPLI